jgi:hypothetical protein
LLLRSLNLPAIIIYKTTNDEYQQGYDLLIKEYKNFQFIKQINFKEEVISNLDDYFMFLCDDDCMIEPFDINGKDFQYFKEHEEILCLSIRLSPYFDGAPEMINNTWRWVRRKHSWGYPMSVSSTIFSNRYVPGKELMLCCSTPKIINNLANQVQTKYRFRNLKISIEQLNDLFLLGNRISLKHMKSRAQYALNCFLMVEYKMITDLSVKGERM